MTENEVKEIIYTQLMKNEQHLISTYMPDEYYNYFWNNISLLCHTNLLSTKKSLNKFCNKLQLHENYNKNTCLQGISEIMFWLYAIRKHIKFEIDKKLHVKNSNNNSDIDIQLMLNKCTINIEVKTPSQEEHNDNSCLNIITPFRTIPDKKIYDSEMNKIEDHIVQSIIENSNGKYKSYEKKKLHDLRVIEYLKSCQNKFTYECNSLNVLAISVPSEMMAFYCAYLVNSRSGIFTDALDNFFNKDGGTISHSDFSMVDAVYLTNMVEGHLRIFSNFDSWKLENYFALCLINPFSQRHLNSDPKDLSIYGNLDMLPNDTARFCKEQEKNSQKNLLEFFSDYFRKYYYHLI